MMYCFYDGKPLFLLRFKIYGFGLWIINIYLSISISFFTMKNKALCYVLCGIRMNYKRHDLEYLVHVDYNTGRPFYKCYENRSDKKGIRCSE